MSDQSSDAGLKSAKDVAFVDLLFSIILAFHNQDSVNGEVMAVISEITRNDPDLTESIHKLMEVTQKAQQDQGDLLAKMKNYLSV